MLTYFRRVDCFRLIRPCQEPKPLFHGSYWKTRHEPGLLRTTIGAPMLVWTHSLSPEDAPFLLLDRDGIINVDRPDYIKHRSEFTIYPDALEALRWLRARRINVILISNQSVLNRGLTTWGDFWDIHRHMVQCVEEAGGGLLAAFYCPHRPDEGCGCRKPRPGMILAARRLFGIRLESTVFIGDKETDVLTAQAAGCEGVLLTRLPLEPERGVTTEEMVLWQSPSVLSVPSSDAVASATLLDTVIRIFGPGPSAGPSSGA